ncbi:cysteine--tRNA ligase [Candidatus Formimonas warabiya]|uniref:Cysteine--tRNA ligase n=1 Tax=Formimonas warabiya TaxID=1761012 RepID=A0A3G1KY03_FORW1|nr:cysteine--tRNA ligase [Candidatus Formimonas warabiya]ATW27095.1 cysteine--tRNA ligase [Candidatus Formimonas warabiya]
MAVKVFNTLTKKKEELVTRDPGKVSMYVCGPTTYNYIHLGNARPLVAFDTVRRYLKYRGYDVTYVQNFTDVDDKIINRSREEGESPAALAQKYINAYFEDADALNVLRADVHPRVTDHMGEIIQMVQGIMEKGLAYEVGGNVYFDVRKFFGYGKLSGRDLDEMKAGARVDVGEEKQDPLDFALWKAAKPGEPSWDSPWGQGRPGWHIECSAMSLKYLGPGFDIHGGGADLIFPHHENEIAQTEAFSGQQFVRYWLHNGFITVNEEKMSKSLGNFFLLRDILARFSPDVIRFYLLSTHYRSPLDFDDQKLHVAEKGLERIRTSLRLVEDTLRMCKKSPDQGQAGAAGELQQKLDAIKAAFIEAMDDDFNTSLAIAAVFDLSREANSFINDSSFKPGKAAVPVLEKALGIFHEFHEVLGMIEPNRPAGIQDQGMDEKLMEIIIDIRQEARKKKDWATADAIRDRLKAAGIILEDTPHGVRWKKIDGAHE